MPWSPLQGRDYSRTGRHFVGTRHPSEAVGAGLGGKTCRNERTRRPSNCAELGFGAGSKDSLRFTTRDGDPHQGRRLEILKGLFGPHADRLQSSLGRASRRHHALLGNLANVSTPGFKRRDVDFNLSLKEAGVDGRTQLRTTHPDHISSARPSRGSPGNDRLDTDERSIRQDGSSVDLETEIAALTETSLRYSALTMLTRRYFQGLKDVIKEGR